MPDITGMRGTGNITQGLRKTAFHQEILELEDDKAPLTVLTSRIGSIGKHNPEFKWAESTLEARSDLLNGDPGTGTTLTVDTGTRWGEHQLWKNSRTGEVVRVVNVVGNTIEVVRGVGGAPIDFNDNDEMIKIGVAKPEGDDISPARSRNATITTNYMQIFREPYSTTETNRIAETFTTPGDWRYAAKHAALEHHIDIEQTIWHGKPSENTAGAQPRRTTGGALHYITTNVTPVGGAMTEPVFFGGLRGPYRYGKKQKTLFCSMLFADVINTFARSKLQPIQSDHDSTYGLNVSRFVSPHGVLSVVTTVALEGTTFGGYGVVLDLSNVRKLHLQSDEGSRDTHIVHDRQNPGVDGKTDELVTEAGLMFGLEKTHGVYTGVTG